MAHHRRQVLLIVLACLLAPLSVLAVWSSNTVSNTDRYVETVAPLANDPDVQAAVTDAVTRQVFTYVDVSALTLQLLDRLQGQGLPPRLAQQLQALAPPISNGGGGVRPRPGREDRGQPGVRHRLDEANRVAHQQMVNVLSGQQGGAVSAKNGQVSINLGPFVDKVKERLVAHGFSVAANIPAVNTSFTVFQSQDVTKAQGAYRLLNTLGTWLPILALVLLAIGVYVAKSHRRALLAAALGVAGGMLLLGVILAVVRPLYLDSVPPQVPHDAAATIYDTLLRFLRVSLRAVLVAALVVAAAAFLTGGTVTAVRTREGLATASAGCGGERSRPGCAPAAWAPGCTGTRRLLRVLVVVAAALALTFWTSPTAGVVLLLAVLALRLPGRGGVPRAAPGPHRRRRRAAAGKPRLTRRTDRRRSPVGAGRPRRPGSSSGWSGGCQGRGHRADGEQVHAVVGQRLQHLGQPTAGQSEEEHTAPPRHRRPRRRTTPPAGTAPAGRGSRSRRGRGPRRTSDTSRPRADSRDTTVGQQVRRQAGRGQDGACLATPIRACPSAASTAWAAVPAP